MGGLWGNGETRCVKSLSVANGKLLTPWATRSFLFAGTVGCLSCWDTGHRTQYTEHKT